MAMQDYFRPCTARNRKVYLSQGENGVIFQTLYCWNVGLRPKKKKREKRGNYNWYSTAIVTCIHSHVMEILWHDIQL